MKPILHNRSRYHQGYYKPMYPLKYIGNPCNIVYRSNWEKVFLKYLDMNPNVLHYASEEIIIPYISPIDNKAHRYFIDFFVEILTKDNIIKRFLVEIKPQSQTKPPKAPKKLSESYQKELTTYIVNQAKWNAAKEYCAKKGLEFLILTENQLFKFAKKKGKK